MRKTEIPERWWFVFRQVQRLAPATLALAVLYVGATLVLRQLPDWTAAPRKQQGLYKDFEGIDSTTGVRILRFYGSPGVIVEGEAVTVCYGVANAQSLELDPPVEPVRPSFNRCLSVEPQEDTRYTLVAKGADGSRVQESFVVQVRPDPFTAPRVKRFTASPRGVEYGKHVFLLSYDIENASAVTLDPPLTRLPGGPNGRFYIATDRTTTLKLQVNGTHWRKAAKSITLAVPEGGGAGTPSKMRWL